MDASLRKILDAQLQDVEMYGHRRSFVLNRVFRGGSEESLDLTCFRAALGELGLSSPEDSSSGKSLVILIF